MVIRREVLVRWSALLALGSPALAQTGVLDQYSPYGSGPPQQVLLDTSTPGTVWQQEVRAGLSGTLEGIQLRLNGAVGAQLDLRVRMGPGWATVAPVFSSVVTKQIAGPEQFFVDCTQANIVQAPGTLFVIDVTGSGVTPVSGVFGTYTPPPAPPLYSRFLFKNGPGCYTDCGTRIGFRTFVINAGNPGVYCVAKNNSLGCTPSIGSSGTPSSTATSGFTISAAQVRNNKPGLLLYGSSGRATTPFQGGILCIQPPIKRSVAVNSGGTLAPISDCSGVYALDLNSFAQGLLGGTPAAFLRTSGTTVDTQYWGRDPGFPAPFDSTLSDAFEYAVP